MNNSAIQIKKNFNNRGYRKKIREFAEYTKQWGGCDKCNEEVEPVNNAVIFDFIRSGMSDWTYYFASNRHLEPTTDENGVVKCEGSPSRWQTVSGIPDPRPEYTGDGEQNEFSLAVWQFMQEEFAPKHHEDEKRLNS